MTGLDDRKLRRQLNVGYIYVQSSASQSSKLMVMENVNFYKMTQTLSDLMLSDFVKTKFVFSKLSNETLNHQQNYKIVLLHSPQI